jgi:hypothetical protein
MKREDKKKKLLEFIEKKKEERRKIREQNKIFRNLKKKEYLEREINKERKSKEEKPLEEDFKLNSKRRKERKEKFLELIARKREEKRKIKQLLLEEKIKKKIELEARRKEEAERREKELEERERKRRLELERREEEAKSKELERIRRRQELINLIKNKVEEREKLRERLLLERKERLKEREEEAKRRKLELEARRKEEAERREKELEERERKRRLELERREEEAKSKELERISNKQKLFHFLNHKKIINQLDREKSIILAEIINLKRLIEKERQKELIEEAKRFREEIKKSLIEKKKEKELQKREILEREKEKQRVRTYLSGIIKTTSEIDKLLKTKISESEKNINNFTGIVRKEILRKKPPKEIPEKVKVVPEKKIKPAVYKEPFNLNVFLRRNIFKFVFLILLIVWLWEFLMFLRKTFLSSEDRLKMIVGGEIEEKRPKEEKKEVVEEEKLVYWTKEKIDIEGKRDPFSTGRLTMEVMKKPVPTNIIFAKKPEVISIIKTPKFVSILKPEEKIEKPETIPPPQISSIEKPQTTKGEEISISSRLPEIGKVSKPEITPFVLPEKECPLIYRGRMILEGVEYIFIEGTKRTYRVTIGDIVEGYRILKKENNKLILSKEGLLYEINAQ